MVTSGKRNKSIFVSLRCNFGESSALVSEGSSCEDKKSVMSTFTTRWHCDTAAKRPSSSRCDWNCKGELRPQCSLFAIWKVIFRKQGTIWCNIYVPQSYSLFIKSLAHSNVFRFQPGGEHVRIREECSFSSVSSAIYSQQCYNISHFCRSCQEFSCD